MKVYSLEAADRLRKRTPEIIRRWEERMRVEIPASRGQHPLALRNNLEPLLTEVASALCPTGDRQAMIEGLTLSEDHGGHRAKLPDYSIGEVFLEYRLLRQVILEVLNEPKRLAPDLREVINEALERAVQEAVSQFARVQRNQERASGDAARQDAAELRTALERERRIAQVLQRPLLLQVAEDAIAGLSLVTIYEPARDEAEVGGDFFDVVPLVGGRVALALGDTCGKGLEAAVHNTHIKDVLRAFLREGPPTAGAILTRLNNVACDVFEADANGEYRFVVLALLIVDPGSGASSYSSAGAEPLLVVRTGGTAEEVERPGLPLGIDRDVRYEETTLELAPGDTAVLVTDGITEARHGKELLGYPGMVQLAQSALQARSLHEAGEQILAGARAFAEGWLSDDACLILACRR